MLHVMLRHIGVPPATIRMIAFGSALMLAGGIGLMVLSA